MEIIETKAGERFVRVADVVKWLAGVVDGIEAECRGVPAGCPETTAYLYGEICSLRATLKAMRRWDNTISSEPDVRAEDPPEEPTDATT